MNGATLTSIETQLSDLLDVAVDEDNRHVEVIDRLDTMIELLERIARAIEEPGREHGPTRGTAVLGGVVVGRPAG